MTQTIFTDAVSIQGSQDITQLQVKGIGTQTQPTQSWLDGTGNILAQITSNGRLQVGDLGVSTPDTLIKASADVTLPSSKPTRGLHALGLITGALTSPYIWSAHELQLLGTGGVSTLQTALRALVTNSNTGSLTGAEVRGGDFQAINQAGTTGNPLPQITGIHGLANNAAGAYATKAVAVEAEIANDTAGNLTTASGFEVLAPKNTGVIGTLYGLKVPDLTQGNTANYAIVTGIGSVQIGDALEAKIIATPANNPAMGYLKIYAKVGVGGPQLYAKDATGVEHRMGGTAFAPLILTSPDSITIPLVVQGTVGQTNDLQQWQTNDGTVVHSIGSSGAMGIFGQADNVQLFVVGSSTQTSDLFQVQNGTGTIVHTVYASGGTYLATTSDDVVLRVQRSVGQTQNLQQWQDENAVVLASITTNGQIVAPTFRMLSGAGAGLFLQSDTAGNASWHSLASADIATALTTPGPVGAMTPSTGAFTTLKMTTGAAAGNFLKSDSAGLGSWNILASADIATALTTPGPIGGTTPSTGAFTTLKATTGAGAGKFLKSDSAGLGSWNILASADIATALTTPGPIGGTTPSTGAFTTLKATTGAGAGKFLKSDASGNGTWNTLVSADIATALATPGAIGSTTPSTGAFTTLKATTGAGAGKFLQSDASGNGTWQTAVSSVAMTVPSILAVSGSPITTSGTLAITLATQTANQVFAGPASGGAAAPTFRALVTADLAAALAAPPAIGGTTPAVGTFTVLTGTTSVGATLADTGTNNVTNLGLLTHNSSGVVAAGLGTGLLFSAQSSTTAGRSQGRMRTQWVTPTDASRAAKMVFSVFDTVERDCLTIQASGTGPQLSVFGATPAAQQTGGVKTAAATYGANEQGMLQTVYNALRTFGYLS